MEKIEKRDKNIIVPSGKYERANTLLASHGINYGDILGGMSIYRHSNRSRRISRPNDARDSGSSVFH